MYYYSNIPHRLLIDSHLISFSHRETVHSIVVALGIVLSFERLVSIKLGFC